MMEERPTPDGDAPHERVGAQADRPDAADVGETPAREHVAEAHTYADEQDRANGTEGGDRVGTNDLDSGKDEDGGDPDRPCGWTAAQLNDLLEGYAALAAGTVTRESARRWVEEKAPDYVVW